MSLNQCAVRTVHGCLEAYAKIDIPCNAYCGNGVHCDLHYHAWGAEALRRDIEEEISDAGASIELVRIEPALEAGPEPEHYIDRIGSSADGFLVFWRLAP